MGRRRESGRRCSRYKRSTCAYEWTEDKGAGEGNAWIRRKVLAIQCNHCQIARLSCWTVGETRLRLAKAKETLFHPEPKLTTVVRHSLRILSPPWPFMTSPFLVRAVQTNDGVWKRPTHCRSLCIRKEKNVWTTNCVTSYLSAVFSKLSRLIQIGVYNSKSPRSSVSVDIWRWW